MRLGFLNFDHRDASKKETSVDFKKVQVLLDKAEASENDWIELHYEDGRVIIGQYKGWRSNGKKKVKEGLFMQLSQREEGSLYTPEGLVDIKKREPAEVVNFLQS